MAQPKTGRAANALEQRTLEALRRRLDRTRAERALAGALERAGVEEIPADTVGFGLFVCGALADAVEQERGRAVAEEVIADLERHFAVQDPRTSGVNRRTPRLQIRAVLLFTRRDDRERELRDSLGRPDTLRVVSDSFALLTHLDAIRKPNLVIVVADDVVFPQGPMLDMIERAVPLRTELVFWGGVPPPALSLPATGLASDARAELIAARCMDATEPERG